MKTRSHVYGNSNIIGKNVEKLRKERGIKQKDFISKLQLTGLDINPTSYSKLEGQVRAATDREVYAIALVLEISMEELFSGSESLSEFFPPSLNGGSKNVENKKKWINSRLCVADGNFIYRYCWGCCSYCCRCRLLSF